MFSNPVFCKEFWLQIEYTGKVLVVFNKVLGKVISYIAIRAFNSQYFACWRGQDFPTILSCDRDLNRSQQSCTNQQWDLLKNVLQTEVPRCCKIDQHNSRYNFFATLWFQRTVCQSSIYLSEAQGDLTYHLHRPARMPITITD